MWAILPIKNLRNCKQRLSAHLGETERQGLCLAMVEDVLAALAGSRLSRRVAVVTSDPEIVRRCRRFGARLIETRDCGHSQAALRAACLLVREGAESAMFLPNDVPAVTAMEIDELARGVLDRPGPAPAAAIVSDRHGTGTNAIAASPPDLVTFSFGPDSLRKHVESARDRGVEPTVPDLPGIRLDIDTMDDLRCFMKIPRWTYTQEFLWESGLADRLDGARPVERVAAGATEVGP
jgi:2-phospho-L-lactate guanylyltransferase